ncbi:MAG: hypothetical protein MI922_03735 [Bacteroidales bacterium]|nr:hypothetical protein [Bacteroidales bacterium]
MIVCNCFFKYIHYNMLGVDFNGYRVSNKISLGGLNNHIFVMNGQIPVMNG